MTRRVWSDGDILEALHLREAEGLTMAAIADRLSNAWGEPVTRNQVISVVNRVIAETNALPDTGDGTMPPRWWQAGLAAREEAA